METRIIIESCDGIDVDERQRAVIDVTDNIVTLATSEYYDECLRFNLTTTECLNDYSIAGYSQRLKL